MMYAATKSISSSICTRLFPIGIWHGYAPRYPTFLDCREDLISPRGYRDIPPYPPCYNFLFPVASSAEDRIDKRFIRTNDRIRAREIRVIGDEGEQNGVMPPFEALKLARSKNLDLVEISPTALPPVCRIMDYGKYLYQQEKKEREAKKHQKTIYK